LAGLRPHQQRIGGQDTAAHNIARQQISAADACRNIVGSNPLRQTFLGKKHSVLSMCMKSQKSVPGDYPQDAGNYFQHSYHIFRSLLGYARIPQQ
jgi:hypothetical protein